VRRHPTRGQLHAPSLSLLLTDSFGLSVTHKSGRWPTTSGTHQRQWHLRAILRERLLESGSRSLVLTQLYDELCKRLIPHAQVVVQLCARPQPQPAFQTLLCRSRGLSHHRLDHAPYLADTEVPTTHSSATRAVPPRLSDPTDRHLACGDGGCGGCCERTCGDLGDQRQVLQLLQRSHGARALCR
jgi:hypothetical protein